MSFIFCCFKTFSLCGFRDCMINSTAFQPPSDKRYNLRLDRHDPFKGPIYKMILYDAQGAAYEPKDLPDTQSIIVWLDTKTRKQIPALFIENKNCKNSFVILYSHGNSTDLGRMYRTLQELSQALNVHVFAYEYNGYGPTQGCVGEMEIIFGIMAAYDFLINKLCFLWSQIILYGRSIGSGPSVFLASHPAYPVSGVILHSPIASGFKVLNFESKHKDKSDLFPNADFIENVKAHVYVMHGEQDTEVSISHGKLIASKCRNLYSPWWVSDGTHNDIDYNHKRPYYIRLSKFLRHIRDFNIDKSENELREFYNVTPWWDKSNHWYFKKIKVIEDKYKKYQEKNGKKLLKSESCSASSRKSLQIHLDGGVHELFQDKNSQDSSRRDSERESDGTEPKSDRKSYVAPKIGSRSFSYKQKNKMKEIEFNSCSFDKPLKELYDADDNLGPRDVKFTSEKIQPLETNATEPTEVGNEETADRLTEREEKFFKQFV